MAKTKIQMATAHIIIYSIKCPECEAFIDREDGSDWYVYEAVPYILTCKKCGCKCRAPEVIDGRATNIAFKE